jgi:hypothetical protein
MPEGILGLARRLRQPAGFHDTAAAHEARAGETPRSAGVAGGPEP